MDFICAFRVDIGVPEGSQGAMFSPLPVELTQYPPEAVACKSCIMILNIYIFENL